MSTTYSFRAECRGDISTFILNYAMFSKGGTIVVKETPLLLQGRDGKPHPSPSGDTVGEFESEESFEDILNIMRKQEDSHIMVQTLQPVPWSENTKERNYDL